jgi:hypothetical protein
MSNEKVTEIIFEQKPFEISYENAVKTINENYMHFRRSFFILNSLVLNDISRSRFPNSSKALYYGALKIEQQLDALEFLGNNGSFYSTAIIYRTIIEHFLVSYLIGINCIHKKIDEVGRQYYNEYRIQENLKRLFTDWDNESMLNGNPKLADEERLKKFNSLNIPGIPFIDTKEKERIYKVASQFQERPIINNIVRTPDGSVNLDYGHFIRMLHIYNLSSSNVHGGPISEIEHLQKGNIDVILNDCDERILMSRYSSFLIRSFLLQILIIQTEDPLYLSIGIGQNLIQQLYSDDFSPFNVIPLPFLDKVIGRNLDFRIPHHARAAYSSSSSI